MGEPKQKRSRSSNYTNEERAVFVELLPKYKHIIENLKTDGVTLRQKEEAWNSLVLDFNSNLNVTKRDLKQLKRFYDNLKRKAKKDRADDRMETFKTGGGTFEPKSDDTTNKLLAIIMDQVEPLQNFVDSDAEYLGNTADKFDTAVTICPNVVIECVEEKEERQMAVIEEEEVQAPIVVEKTSGRSATSSTISASFSTPEAVPSSSYEQTTPSQYPRWMNRNRPTTSKKQTEASKARVNIAELSHRRKQLCEKEEQLLRENENRDLIIHELKKEVLEIKKRAQLAKEKAQVAKENYYKEKLARLQNV